MPVKSPIRKITVWPEVLELAHLVEQHGVPEVQVRRRRVETGLDAQRTSRLQARLQFVGLDDLVGTTADDLQRLLQLCHGYLCPFR